VFPRSGAAVHEIVPLIAPGAACLHGPQPRPAHAITFILAHMTTITLRVPLPTLKAQPLTGKTRLSSQLFKRFEQPKQAGSFPYVTKFDTKRLYLDEKVLDVYDLVADERLEEDAH